MGKKGNKRSIKEQMSHNIPRPQKNNLSAGFKWRYIIVIIAVSLAVYSNTLYMDFVWDDAFQIRGNNMIKSLNNILSLFTSSVWSGIKGHSGGDSYRPIFTLSLAADYFLWGEKPFGYHLTNIILHVIASVVFYFLALKFLKNDVASFFAGLLFSVHPVHAEAVAWISARNEMLSAIFMLSSFYMYILYKEYARLIHVIFSILLFSLSLLSKETAVTLPAIILLYELCCGDGKSKKAIQWPVLYGLIVVLYIILRTIILKYTWGNHPLSWRLFTAPGIIIEYLRLLVFPINLEVFYDIPIKKSFFTQGVLSPLFLLGVLFSCLILLLRYDKKIFFSMVFILIALFPVSGLIAFTSPALMAERYLYIPSIGFSLAIGAISSLVLNNIGMFNSRQKNIPATPVQTFSSKPKVIVISGGILLIAVLSVLNFQRNYKWSDDYTFMTQMVKDAPDSAFARFSLGTIYDNLGRLEEASREYQSAIGLNPDYVEAHNDLGIVYDKQGKFDEAVREYQTALKLRPEHIEAHNNLGIVYEKQGRYDDAVIEFQTILRIRPDSINAHKNLGMVLKKLSRYEEAIKEFRDAIKISPEDAVLHNSLGAVFFEQRQFDDASREFRTSVRLSPDYAEAHNNLGLIFRNQKQFDEAAREFHTALKLDPDYAEAHNNLGVLYAMQGRIDNAITHFQKASFQNPGNELFRLNLKRAKEDKARKKE